jgi:TolA-binding protein
MNEEKLKELEAKIEDLQKKVEELENYDIKKMQKRITEFYDYFLRLFENDIEFRKKYIALSKGLAKCIKQLNQIKKTNK